MELLHEFSHCSHLCYQFQGPFTDRQALFNKLLLFLMCWPFSGPLILSLMYVNFDIQCSQYVFYVLSSGSPRSRGLALPKSPYLSFPKLMSDLKTYLVPSDMALITKYHTAFLVYIFSLNSFLLYLKMLLYGLLSRNIVCPIVL